MRYKYDLYVQIQFDINLIELYTLEYLKLKTIINELC